MKITLDKSEGEAGNAAAAKTDFSAAVRLRTFSSLRYRDYRFLWISILFMSGGQWMQQVALSWLIYQMTDSAFMLGAINGVGAIPFLIFGPWGGVAADRLDRKKLMLITQAYLLVFTLALGLLIVTEMLQVWHLFAFTFFTGVGWSFTMPVRQALIPSLVPREDLVNAVGLQSTAFTSTRILGPTAAGILIASVGPGLTFLLTSLAYLAILALVAQIRVPAAARDSTLTSPIQDLTEGFRYIGRNRLILHLILLALIPMTFAMPIQTLLPVFARDILEMGPKGYGLLVSFAGAGALIGTLAVASLGGYQRKGLLLMSSALAMGVALVLFSRSDWLPTSLLFITFVGGFQMLYMSLNNTLLHANITDDVRGRVMSIYMLDFGLSPIGSLFAGTIANFYGAPLAVTILGSFCVLFGLIAILRVPGVRRLP
ncbi:MAG: MFS transporter [Dehalococcoidia bacterium]|nr:MFS transporter [Dehalococcoidia bacterium]